MVVSECRRSKREASNLSVYCWVMDRNYNPILVDSVPASCLNISSHGMVLEWPLWWKCKGCPYSQKKLTRHYCVMEKCPFENTSRFLVAAALLKICVKDKKTEHYANVIWVKEKENCCHVGVSFIQPSVEFQS